MPDFSTLTDSLSKFTDSFSQYIVRPLNAFGLGGFVFDVEGETTVRLQAEITDHYTEQNEAIQDHIAIRPKTVNLKNYVGELVYRVDDDTDTVLQSAVQKLTILSSYLPQLSAAATQAKATYDKLAADNYGISNIFDSGADLSALSDSFAGTTVQDAANLWGIVKTLSPPVSKQEQAYLFFKALHEQKIIVSVQTPFEFMTSMAVESVIAVQEEGTQSISDFSISLKEIRYAQTKFVNYDASSYQSKTGLQAAPVTTGGKVNGVPTTLDPTPTAPPVALPSSLSVSDLTNVAPSPQKPLAPQIDHDVAKLGGNKFPDLPTVPGIN